MDDYKPNSYKFKERQKALASSEDKKIEKVVKGTVRTKKRSGLTKITEQLVSEDVNNVKSYILTDVFIPAVKKLVYDIITDGFSMILYGSTGAGKKKTIGSNVSYRQFYDRRDDDRRTLSTSSSRFEYDDLIFDSRGEAEAVLNQMDVIIDTYGFVSVADLYDLADLSAPYTSNKYGWTNVSTADVARLRDGGYVIKLPRAMPIK